MSGQRLFSAAKVYSEKARCLLDYDEASVETKLVCIYAQLVMKYMLYFRWR